MASSKSPLQKQQARLKAEYSHGGRGSGGSKPFTDAERVSIKRGLEKAASASRMKKLGGFIGRGLLSPAVLADEVAARAVRDVTAKREDLVGRKRMTKMPRTKA